MRKTIISDTSCFIVLTNIGELDLLRKIYGKVITTADIAAEYGEPLPDWVEIEKVRDKHKQEILEMQLDKGEASAIALAIEMPGSVVVLDDYRARKVALKLNINYTGTLGIIIKAKLSKIIPSIKPFLEKIKQTDFRITEELEQQALKEAGE